MSNKVSKTVEGNLNRSGRPKGVPNKVTQEAREAVKQLLDANLPYLQTWLYNTAEGLKDDETGKYIVLPNPGKACDIVQNMVEYAVPKLARTEMVGDPNAPIVHKVYKWKD
jgi:hypothetical protein